MRGYSFAAAEKLAGKMVQCDEKTCDGVPCGGTQNHPHIYDDEECCWSCCHPGHDGLCVAVNPAEHVEYDV